MVKKSLQVGTEKLYELHEKYFDLVWYARRRPGDDFGEALQAMERIEAQYPQDVDELADPDSGDWTHGFNSGMLAAIRLVMENFSEDALDEFPSLDT